MKQPIIKAGTIAGGVLAGAAAGYLLERTVIGRRFRLGPDGSDVQMGAIHSPAVTVITDDGIALHAEIDEPIDASQGDLTVVFSHGFALNLDEWHFQRRDLGACGRLVFWDQRSHGRSGRGSPDSLTIDQLGQDLACVIEQCAPHGPVVLVGHSMGGMTMMALADQHREWFGDRIVGAALLGTSSGHINQVRFGLPKAAAALAASRVDRVAAALRTRAVVIDKRRARASDLMMMLLKLYSFAGSTSPDQTQFVVDMISSTPIEVVADFLPELSRHDKTAALAAFQDVETLVMVGDSDLLTPPRHSYELVRHIPGAEFVILPESGHMIPIERYPNVNSHLRDLITRVRRSLSPAP